MAGKYKVNVVTLGCPKNLVDSEFLLGQLKHSTVQLVTKSEDADAVVINTCGFIQDAKRESIETILEAVKKKKRGEIKSIVVMGCLSERFKDDLASEIPEVDAFFGTNQLPAILKYFDIDYKADLLGERLLTAPAHSAYLKISDGCDHPCSFCAIPLMRGKYRSRPLEDLIHEAKLLAQQKVKELIIIAQDTTSYGLDIYGERRLAALLRNLDEIDGFQWIRLMYTYPAKFPLDILEVIQNSAKFCRYLDIPIQHSSDTLLKSMRRGISQKATRELLLHIKNKIPDIALRTTLIVGYPGESESDFKDLYDFVEEMQFHRLGVFPYSQEEGTAAFNLGDPIPAELKQERLAMIMELQKEISEQYNQSFVGKTLQVLIDRKEQEYSIGRTEWDAPEIDQEVLIRNSPSLTIGEFYSARIIDNTEYDLIASVNHGS